MALLWSDRFETGDVGAWTASLVVGTGNSNTVETGSLRDAGYWAKHVLASETVGQAILRRHGLALTELWARWFLYIDSHALTAGMDLILGALRLSTNADVLVIKGDTQAGGSLLLGATNSVAGTTTWSSGSTARYLVVGREHVIEVYAKVGSGAAWALWLDGDVAVAQVSEDLGSTAIDRLVIGLQHDGAGIKPVTAHTDDAAVAAHRIGPVARPAGFRPWRDKLTAAGRRMGRARLIYR